jgi:hypothetical protein
MAAITPVTFSPYLVLRNVSAQATTGQTDWLDVPGWVQSILVTLNITANAGGTPTTILTLRAPDPVTRDDTSDHAVLLTGATITAASFHHYAIAGSFVTAGTDSATTDSSVVQNSPIPRTLGVRVTNDRGSADETYTYTLTVSFKGK